MATEQDKATLTQIRGKQAAAMPHAEAKEYVKGSAKMDKDYAGTAEETAGVSRKQQAQQVLGSFKQGGNVPKTGNYKLHAGEKVLTKKQADTLSTQSYVHGLNEGYTNPAKGTQGAEATYSASKVGNEGLFSHGPNGNMVRRGSSAIAPHDKDK